MPEYMYKKVRIDKDDPTATVSIPVDAIHVDVKYGVHDIPGHIIMQWLEPVRSTTQENETICFDASHNPNSKRLSIGICATPDRPTQPKPDPLRWRDKY